MNNLYRHPPELDNDLWQRAMEKITPFGWYVQHLLCEYALGQNDLARMLGMAPSNLSTMLRGRKGPIPVSVIDDIALTLKLNDDEHRTLRHAAKLSKTNFELRDLQPWQYSLAAEFHLGLAALRRENGRIINAVLASNKHQNACVESEESSARKSSADTSTEYHSR